MLGTSLTKSGEILCNGKITGHTNFLSATNPHTVGPAYYRLIAHQNGRNHVIEEPHVLLVFLRITCIVLCVFFGVATGAKCFISNGSKHYRSDTSVVGSFAECESSFFYGLGGIGVVLLWIIKYYLCIEKAFHVIAI